MHSLIPFVAWAAFSHAVTLPSQCSCGYQDPLSLSVYTEALIVYFNETDTIDQFIVGDFAHKKEHGWNSIYKVGASRENARIINNTDFVPQLQVLELLTDPSTPEHLVNGGHLQSVRQDLQFGSFQAGLMPASAWTGGTALSFELYYNSSESLEMDFMNMNEPSDARVSTLVNGEWPETDICTSFSTLEAAGLHPWTEFTTFRMDWNMTDVEFYIGNMKARAVSHKERSLPVTGQTLQLKSWSTGDSTYMEGPPTSNATQSQTLWVRAFFNSSSMTNADHAAFNARCQDHCYCYTNDTELRGASSYSIASEAKWEPPPGDNSIHRKAGIVAACCSSIGICCLVNIFFRRTPWRILWPRKQTTFNEKMTPEYGRSEWGDSTPHFGGDTSSSCSTSGILTPLPAYGAQTPRSGYLTPVPAYYGRLGQFDFPRSLSLASTPQIGSSQTNLLREGGNLYSQKQARDDSLNKIDEIPSLDHTNNIRTQPQNPLVEENVHKIVDDERGQVQLRDEIQTCNPYTDVHVLSKHSDEKPVNLTVSEKGRQASSTVMPRGSRTELERIGEKPATSKEPTPKGQVDYLAGLVAVACLGVSLHHFIQTFLPWVADGYGYAHYPKVERWLSLFLGSIILTQLWIGPFFLTATRFLTTNFLKNGNLEDIAKKELRRAPRLFVPIIIVSTLEYFLISMNLTSPLQWLPSVSWSTWPYVVAAPNFGVELNDLIQLAYVMPNAIPEIVTHYCIGVLWTVPIQLQFTYVVLAAAVLIRDIKSPWKRFGFYTLAILSGWYAKSWGACHWCGLLLSDLENTYHWKIYLRKHLVVRYLIISVAVVITGGSCLVGAFNQQWSFDIAENGIHPDLDTGNPIMDVDPSYPGYEDPTLSQLLFAVGLQILVELSAWVQAFLSIKPILWLRPHVMTIYLTHGFIMWTWGAWVTIALNSAGVPYWANLIVNLCSTYTMIFLLATVLTPLLDIATQAAMKNIDRWTKEEPRPRRNTTAPFSKDLILNRHGKELAEDEP